jgi:cell division protein FtsB
MPALSPRPTDAQRPAGTEVLRRKRIPPAPFSVFGRRTVHFLLVFVTIVLVVDALVGEKGFIETLRARREYRDVSRSLESLRRENSRLREDVRRLNEDPGAIEAVARKELGLIRPGELLFVVKDAKSDR